MLLIVVTFLDSKGNETEFCFGGEIEEAFNSARHFVTYKKEVLQAVIFDRNQFFELPLEDFYSNPFESLQHEWESILKEKKT